MLLRWSHTGGNVPRACSRGSNWEVLIHSCLFFCEEHQLLS